MQAGSPKESVTSPSEPQSNNLDITLSQFLGVSGRSDPKKVPFIRKKDHIEPD